MNVLFEMTAFEVPAPRPPAVVRAMNELRQYDEARGAIKDLVEMPDPDADRIIRSLKEGGWQVSNKLRKTLPQIFAEDGAFYTRHAQIIAAVRAVFEGERPEAEES